MNYAGRFDGAISSEGLGNHSHFVHLNPGHSHAPADAIVVPDAHFLFNADFKRSGVDLVLSRDDHELVLHDYFKGAKHKALASPDGAHLTGGMVDALTGYVEVAQAAGGPAAASAVIGHVTKLAGSATVIRNGVSIILNMGDNVEKGDVVQSGSNSTVGITFIDGTVFGLSSNARMVLNEMVYDPNGSNNSSLLSLVSGTITFVAGETAKHGDMKIDTPVATMGIRGTAVLVEIDFAAGANAPPNASFQVLVEPDGTTGSYILFDKTTLQPLAIVNQAGQQININNGVISQTQNPLSPDAQQLVKDVFKQMFSDNNTNTKTATTVSSPTPDGGTLTLKFAQNQLPLTSGQGTDNNGTKDKAAPSSPTTGTGPTHISGTLALQLLGGSAPQSTFALKELVGKTGDTTDPPDFVGGVFQFTDINPGDQPHVTADFASVTYTGVNGSFTIDAGQATPTAGLSQLQFADIMATAVNLLLFPAADNANNGTVSWVYEVPDNEFDFLAAGETLTFTYHVTVAVVFNGTTEQVEHDLTIIVTGTNDQPIITTDKQTQLIHFAAGTGTSGGSLVSPDTTGGTYAFTDVDLTDTHWIVNSAADTTTHVHKGVLVGASLNGMNLAALQALAPGPMSVFAQALDADVTTESTGTGNGTITWKLEKLPVFLADFIPAGETLKLFYTITLTDEQGSTDTKIVEVDITGTNAAATVWVHTVGDGHNNNWTTGSNWGTGNVPTSVNDVIIVTDQLHPNTPAYPATITTGTNAAAHSVVMNDFVASPTENIPPELKLQSGSSLIIGADFDLSADSILTNAGTVNVGGKLELLDDSTNPVTPVNKSVITNSGTIKIAQGGDIQGLASVTNSGTIELLGGTLNLDVNVANTDGVTGGNINVDSGAKLVLGTDVNVGGVVGGTVTVNGAHLDFNTNVLTAAGELDFTGGNVLKSGTLANKGVISVTGTGNKLDGETITNGISATIEVKSGDLTIDHGSSVANSAGIKVDAGAKLAVNGSTITGLGFISGVDRVTNDGDMELTGAAILSDGTLINNATVNVTGTGNTFDSETVTDNGTIDVASGALLTLVGNTTIFGGSASTSSVVTVQGALTVVGAASITGAHVTVANAGTLTLQDEGVLAGGTLTNGNQVNVTGSGIVWDVTVTNNGTIDVASGSRLTVEQNTAITNGASGNSETVEGTLDLQDISSITAGAVTVNGGGTLNLKDSSIVSGAAVSSVGTVNLSGTAALKSGSLTNTGQVNVSGSGVLLAVETVSNTGGASAIDITGSLTLQDGTAITNQNANSGEMVESGASLTLLDTSSITNGKLVNLGTVSVEESTGATLDNVDVTGGGTINVDAPSASPATLILKDGTSITSGSIEIGSVGTLEVSAGGATLTGVTVDVTSGGIVTVDGSSILDLSGTNISGGQLTNAGKLINVAGNDTISASVTNTGTIEVQHGTLDLSGGLTGVGTLDIDSGTTLEIAGANAQTVTFTGGTGKLQLDNTAIPFTGTITGTSSAAGDFTVTGAANITTTSGDALDFNSSGGTSGNPATVTVSTSGTLTGAANGIKVVQNGTGDIGVTTSAAVKGNAGDGILAEVTATGSGNVTVNATGKVTGTGTNNVGILAENLNTANNGNVTVTSTGGVSGNLNGIQAVVSGSGNVSVTAGGEIDSTVRYGIRAQNDGTGSISVVTDATTVINSGGTGLSAINTNTNVTNATITVTAHGTINFGPTNNLSGSVPKGIDAGFFAGDGTAHPGVQGSVVVNNDANITQTSLGADGNGVNAFTEGVGNVTVNQGANTTISAAQIGIGAFVQGGGAGNITVNVADHVQISTASSFGIQASTVGSGSVAVNMTDATDTDTITSGSSGIVAINAAATLNATALSTITVNAHGTINSGSSGTNTIAGIIAGYTGLGAGNTNTPVANHNVNGAVTINNFANITAAAGYGIDAFNFGEGNVTVNDQDGTTINAASSVAGIGAFSLGQGTGDVAVNLLGDANVANTVGFGINASNTGAGTLAINTSQASQVTGGSVGINATASGGKLTIATNGTVSGKTGVSAGTTGSNDIAITNAGSITGSGTGTGNAGINVAQVGTNATGSTTITNSGTIVGNGSHAAILVAENVTGTTTITNTGTIGAAGATVQAIAETGGHLTINNNTLIVGQTVTHGVIDGAISAASTTFTNEAGATWNAVGSSTFGAASSLDNAGAIDLASASISDASGLTITNETGGVIDGVSGTNLISGATITNAGTIESTGGTLTIDPAVQLTLTNTGTLEAITGGTLKLSNISVANSVTDAQGTHDGTVSTDSTSFLDLDNSSITNGNVNNAGTILSTGISAIDAIITNTKIIEVGSGTLTLSGSISGSGSATIDGSATLALGSHFIDGQNVTFNGSGAELIIAGSASLTGNIHGLVASDEIDLQGINFASATATYLNGVLTVTDGNNDLVSLNIGTGVSLQFAGSADSNGVNPGTLITLKATDDAPTIISATSDQIQVSAVAGDTSTDHAGGTISFADVDLTDRPVVTAPFAGYTYKAADGTTDLTLTDAQKADVEAALTITPAANNANNGSATWSYDVVDSEFDFLAQGETLTLTYTATVTDSQGVPATQPITVTIHGANHGTDNAPTIATADRNQTATLTEVAGQTGVTSTDASTPASGTIHFSDVDLTDKPTASVTAQTATYLAADGTTHLTLTAGELSAIEHGFTVSAEAGNTNNGAIDWSYGVADNALDFLAAGEKVTLVSTVTVDDGHGGKASTPVTITITGSDDAPTIATADLNQTATLTEVAGQTGVTGTDASTPASGTIHFSDVDLTDRPTASVTAQAATYLAADGTTHLTLTAGELSAIEHGFTVSAEAGNTNNGTIDWSYGVADNALDFLAAGEKVTLVSTVTVDDGHTGKVSTPVTITITGTDDAPTINGSSITTGTVADGGVFQTNGTLTGSDVDNGDTQTWTINGGTDVASESFDYGLHELKVVDTSNGINFDDKFNNTAPPNGPNGAGTYSLGGGTIVAGSGSSPAQFDANNATPVGISLNSASYGQIVYGQFATLLTNNTPGSAAGLRSGQNFTASATFDLDNPADINTRYGIRLSDRQSSPGTNDTPAQPGTESVDLAVVHNADGTMSVVLNEINFETGVATRLQTLALIPSAGDNEISLSLSNAAATNGHIVASYQLFKSVGGVEVADGGPVTFTSTGQIFDNEDWTHVQVYGQSVAEPASTPGAVTANTVSYLQGTYGTLAVNETNGTWNYYLNPGLASVKALGAGETAIDHFTVTATDKSGETASTPVNITVTGINDAPVVVSTSNQLNGTVTEAAVATNSSTHDTANGTVAFTDPDLHDSHTVTITGVTASGTAAGLPDNATLKGWLTLGTLTDSTNGATGSDGWTFSAPDSNFDYLGAGQQVTLTYGVQVADNHGGTTTTPVTITITGTNDAPVITNGGAATIAASEGTPVAISGLSVSDPDSNAGPEQLTLQVGHGTLAVSEQNGLAVDNTDGTLTLTGSLADINIALATLSYQASSNSSGTDNLHLSLDDQVQDVALTTTKDIAIGVAAGSLSVTVPTTVDAAPDNIQHFVFPTIDISDPNSTTLDHAQVSWSGFISGGISFAGLTFSGPTGNITEGIQITLEPDGHTYDFTSVQPGVSIADYEDVLSHLTLNSWDPETVTFTVTVNDGTGSGDSVPASTTVNVAVPSTWDVWTGHNDNDWNDPTASANSSNWSLGHVPGPSDYVFIEDATVTDDLGENDADQSITQLHLASSGFGPILDITNSSDNSHTFTIAGALDADGSREALANAGTITVRNLNISGGDGTSAATSLSLDIQGNVRNSGTIATENNQNVASGSSSSSIVSAHFSGAVENSGTISVAVATSGSGTATATFAGDVSNTGTISADGNGATLIFDAVTVSQLNGINPPGIIDSTDDSVIVFDGTTVSGGQINGDSSANLLIQVGDSSFAGSGPALTLEDGVTVVDESMTIGSGDTLLIEHGSISPGATLDNVTVIDNGTVQVDGLTTLTLTDGTNITGGALNIGSGGTVDVEAGFQEGSLDGQPFDALLDNVAVTGGGTIEVNLGDGGAILMLADGTSITGGTLHIGESGEVYVQSGVNGDVTLDHVTVTVDNGGEIELGAPVSQGSTLVLDDGTTISGGGILGGFLSLDNNDVLEIATGSNEVGATLDHIEVDNSGTIQVGSSLTSGDATLTLQDGTRIIGGTLDIEVGGEVNVQDGSHGGVTLDGVAVTNGGDGIEIGGGATLLLTDGASIALQGANAQITDDGAGSELNLLNGTISGVGTIGNGNLSLLSSAAADSTHEGGIVEAFGGTLTIDVGSFNNQGILIAEGGGTLDVNTLSNLTDDPVFPGGGILTGGSYDVTDGDGVDNGSSIVLNTALPAITTLNAAVQLEGPNASIVSGDVDLQDSLLKISAGGSLYLGGADAGLGHAATGFDDSNALEVAGSITLNGGTLEAQGLTIDPGPSGTVSGGGVIKGFGVISVPVHGDSNHTLHNEGAIIAENGALEINAQITGPGDTTGLMEIEGSATLHIDATQIGLDGLQASIQNQSIQFNNDGANEQLIIDGAAINDPNAGQNIGAIINGFVTGDSIDLTGISANGYSFNGTTLVLTENGTQVGSLTLTGLSSGTQFNVGSDGPGGGTLITEATAFSIQQGSQNVSAADDGNWNAAGQFTTNAANNDPLTWSIVGGSNYVTGSYQFGIDEFNVVNTNNGNTPTTIFDDSFNGTVPPAGPAIQNASSPSGVSYSNFNSGTYVPGVGEALIESSHDGYLGAALGVSSFGDPVFGQFTTLLTGTSSNTTDTADGLRSGQSFTVNGTFDLAAFTDTTSRYGIRLSDRVSNAVNPANDQPGTEVVDLGVSMNGNGTASVIFSELNYETGVSDNLQIATINAQPGDNKIQLSLTNDASNNGVVVASYTLFKSDGAGGEVADGTFTLGAVGHIFDNENWTRAQFYAFDVSTTTSSSPQADSILQGTYGQLDLAQDGTWHYQLNPGLPSVKALAAGVTAQDIFHVNVTDATGQHSTQTITVNVTGTNDAPVAIAPAALLAAANINLSLRGVGLSVSDADGGASIETATLSVGEGIITIAAGNSGVAIVGGNGTGSVTISGTIAQLNALLSTTAGTGTIVYNDNAASPNSQIQLKLTINDGGLSGMASSTINIGSQGETLDWKGEIDPYAAATTATSAKWVIPNSDGLTSTVFNGANFTYDATTHLPTGGGIGSIQLVDNATGHVLQTISSGIAGVGLALQLGDFGNFLAREQAIQHEIPWTGLIETGNVHPISFGATDIRLANSDGTVTEIIGSNFAQFPSDQLAGTVTAVKLLDANGNVLNTVSLNAGTSLQDIASAVFPDNLSKQFYNLMAQGNTTVSGLQSSAGSGAVSYVEIDDTPGNHAYVSPSTGIVGVNFGEATSGVTVNLATGTATWGAYHDTLTNMSFVQGSNFADSIVGNPGSNVLSGGGGNDVLDPNGSNGGAQTLIGGSGADTFVYGAGDGAVTTSDFDQGNSGTFDPAEGDQVELNGLSQPVSIAPDGNGNTIADFGGGDVLTFVNMSPADVERISSVVLVPGNGVTYNPAINSGTLGLSATTSQSFKIAGLPISSSGGAGVNLQVNDANVADIVLLDIDAASSVSSTATGAQGILINSNSASAASIDLVNNADVTTSSASSTNTSPPPNNGAVGINITRQGGGNITLINTGDINAGSTGIVAGNSAASISPSLNSFIFVSNFGAITAGPNVQPNGQAASGIWAGYGAGTATNTFGTVVVDNNANVTATSGGGNGIVAFNNSNGDVTVNNGPGTIVQGANIGIEALTNNRGGPGSLATAGAGSASGDVTVNLSQNVTVESTTSYGIFAQNLNNVEGNITVTMAAGDRITSGGTGINAFDGAPSLPGGGTILVNAEGTIQSGSALNGTGGQPAGILAGFLGNPAGIAPSAGNFPIAGLNGNVIINSAADITAAVGDGIRGYNYGLADFTNGFGNITINVTAGTITARALTGTTNGNGDGISAQNNGGGSIFVTTAAGVSIKAGGSGIAANDGDNGNAVSVSSSSLISVVAAGTIESGTNPAILTGSSTPTAGILAGYNPNANGSNTVFANVDGNVIIDDHAHITADVGDGIRGYNFGTGDVTITVESDSTVQGARWGVAGFTFDGGHVSLTNYGSITGGTDAIDINVNGSLPSVGTATVDNHGHLTGSVAALDTTFINESNGVWSMNGTSQFSGTSTLTNQGSIGFNGGTIEVQSGSLSLIGTISGAGTFKIDAGATLEFASGVASNQTVVFGADTGVLKLDDPQDFHGTIAGISHTSETDILRLEGFTAGDIIHASTTGGFNSADNTTTLTIDDQTSGQDLTFTLAGDYSQSIWHVTDDSGGQFDIVDPPAADDQLGSVIMHDPGPAAGQPLGGVIMNDPGPAASQPTVIAAGASAEISAPSSETVTFTGATGSLVIDHPADFRGHIAGFTGTAPDAEHSDTIDLAGIDFNSAQFAETYNASTGLLSVTDGRSRASFTFDNFKATLDFASDGKGGTLITDPPATGANAQDFIHTVLHDLDPNGSFVFNPSSPGLLLQHFLEELPETLSPLRDIVHSGSSAMMLPQTGVVDLAALYDSVRHLPSHADLHL